LETDVNWWTYTILTLAWFIVCLLWVPMLQTLVGPTTGPLGDRRSLLPEAAAIVSTTAMFLGLLVILQ
jgi:hypothetical protein